MSSRMQTRGASRMERSQRREDSNATRQNSRSPNGMSQNTATLTMASGVQTCVQDVQKHMLIIQLHAGNDSDPSCRLMLTQKVRHLDEEEHDNTKKYSKALEPHTKNAPENSPGLEPTGDEGEDSFHFGDLLNTPRLEEAEEEEKPIREEEDAFPSFVEDDGPFIDPEFMEAEESMEVEPNVQHNEAEAMIECLLACGSRTWRQQKQFRG